MAHFKISNDGSIGVQNNAGGNINITNVINKINVPKHEIPLRGFRFQVAAAVASFGGRDYELESVQRAFKEQKNMKPYNLVTVCGYGGIGKTEFARKFIQILSKDFTVIWINSEFESTTDDSFNKLQKELERSEYPCSGHQDVYKHFNNPECLFVFDNAENKKSISKYLPQENNNSLFLITSQYRTWSPHKSVALDKLDPASSINIVKVILSTHGINITERQQLKLLRNLEPIPLVLQIGVGFVCQEVLGLKDIGKEYNIDDIIGELSTECELVTLEFPPFDQNVYDTSVLVALSRTMEKFWNKEDEVSKTAKSMLGVAAYLNADRIEEYILKELLNMEDKKLFNKSLITLVQFSLFQKTHYNIGAFTIHRTVQECVRYLCRNKSKLNECYLLSLHVLLNNNFDYQQHHELIIQHAEKDFETFKSFYGGNKCRTLYEALTKHISCYILQLMLDNFDLIKDPEFLCEAAASERADVIQKLLEHGANFNVMNSEGLGVLYYACCWSGSLDDTWKRIAALIKVGANINLQNSQGNTVIHNLCNMGKNCTENDEDIFKWCVFMIKAGGDPTIKNSAGKTPTDLAQEHGLQQTRRLLEEVTSGYRFIQHIAARCKQFNSLMSLLKLGICDIKEQNESGNTVLHVLAGIDPLPVEDEVNEIELPYFTADLMRWRTDVVYMKNNSGETAADVATRANRRQLVDVFNAIHSDHIIYDTAVYRQQIEHFSFVSNQQRRYVNERDVNGGTLLHALSRLDAHGRADLELEVVNLVADLLMWFGADVRIKDNAGVSGADVARSRGWRLLADILDGDYATIFIFERRDKVIDKLVYLAVKHGRFDLLKCLWWRYYYFSSTKLFLTLFDYRDLTDTAIISALNVINYKGEFQNTIDDINNYGWNEVVNLWKDIVRI